MAKKSLLDVFAANVRQGRTKKRLSQSQLAKATDLSVSYISMLERGQRSPPLPTLETMAKALGTTPDALLRVNGA